MRPLTLTDAVDAALDGGADIWISDRPAPSWPSRTESAHCARVAILRAKMFAVLQDLPDDLTVRELREALAPAGWVAPERDPEDDDE